LIAERHAGVQAFATSTAAMIARHLGRRRGFVGEGGRSVEVGLALKPVSELGGVIALFHVIYAKARKCRTTGRASEASPSGVFSTDRRPD